MASPDNTSTGVAIKKTQPQPLTEDQIKAAQELQSRIASGNMALTPEEQQAQGAAKIAEQLAISRGEAPQVAPKVEPPQVITNQEQLADKLQNQFGANNGNQAVNDDVSIQAERKPVYLGDYSNSPDLVEIARKANVPVQDVFADYQRWGRDTGNPTDFLRILNASQKGDISKTPQKNEAEEKKRVGQERMEKFANFLKHLGNFVGTVGFGAPSQTLEHPKELTARQQALRDKTEALRSAYNKSYFENYYKQRAEEMNQQKLKLAQRQQDQRDAQQYLNERRFELDEKIKNGTLDLKKLEYELKQKVAEGKLTHQAAQDALGWARNALGWARENRQASGTVTEITKPKYGKPETVTRVVRPGNSAGSKPAGGQGNKGKGYGSGKEKGRGY